MGEEKDRSGRERQERNEERERERRMAKGRRVEEWDRKEIRSLVSFILSLYSPLPPVSSFFPKVYGLEVDIVTILSGSQRERHSQSLLFTVGLGR